MRRYGGRRLIRLGLSWFFLRIKRFKQSVSTHVPPSLAYTPTLVLFSFSTVLNAGSLPLLEKRLKTHSRPNRPQATGRRVTPPLQLLKPVVGMRQDKALAVAAVRIMSLAVVPTSTSHLPTTGGAAAAAAAAVVAIRFREPTVRVYRVTSDSREGQVRVLAPPVHAWVRAALMLSPRHMGGNRSSNYVSLMRRLVATKEDSEPRTCCC